LPPWRKPHDNAGVFRQAAWQPLTFTNSDSGQTRPAFQSFIMFAVQTPKSVAGQNFSQPLLRASFIESLLLEAASTIHQAMSPVVLREKGCNGSRAGFSGKTKKHATESSWKERVNGTICLQRSSPSMPLRTVAFGGNLNLEEGNQMAKMKAVRVA